MSRFKKFIKRLFITLITFGILIVIGSIVITSMYPLAHKDYINKYSKEYNINPFLIASIINIESRYDKEAVSHRDAKGLMQIGPSTGQWASEELNIENYNPDMLFDPETNIRIGTWYINKLSSEFDQNVDLVLAAYNGGSGNVQKWLKDKKHSADGENLHNIPFYETDNYVKEVKKNYKIYKLLYKNYMDKPDDYRSLYIDFINNVRKYFKGLSLSN